MAHGLNLALESLGNYPEDSLYYLIDHIDYCSLFLVNLDPSKTKSEYDQQHFLVAIWDDDLLELKYRGFLDGVYSENNLDYQLIDYNKFKKMQIALGYDISEQSHGLYINTNDGDLLFIEKPTKELIEIDEDSYDFKYARIPNNNISLTTEGISSLKRSSSSDNIHIIIFERIEPLININYYDTAIREAMLILNIKTIIEYLFLAQN